MSVPVVHLPAKSAPWAIGTLATILFIDLLVLGFGPPRDLVFEVAPIVLLIPAVILFTETFGLGAPDLPRGVLAGGLALLLLCCVGTFGAAYYVHAARDPAAFGRPLRVFDALYVAAGGLMGGADGFETRTDGVRIVQMAQWVSNLVILGITIAAVSGRLVRKSSP